MLTLTLVLLTQAVDLDAVRAKADALLEEAKTGYESARASGSVPGFVDAGFKLEEARIKYLVLMEIGTTELQKAAADRLRAVNQLNKLLNDGRVAIQKPAPSPDAPPPPPAADLPEPAAPPPAVTARAAVPDAAKQKEAEKLVRDLFKDRYARKAPADRQALARDLLKQAAQSADDPAGLWVLYREARDVAIQGGHIDLAVAAVEATSRAFDVDGLALKSAALTGAASAVKTPGESASLADALLRHVDELMSADQYDAADKAAASAQQHAKKAGDAARAKRTANRAKEVAEAKAKFQGLKKTLETLAKTPGDPAANAELGQFHCFVKANWDLGLRFLAKGSDAALRGLAEREIASDANAADAWYDYAQGDKNPLRKSGTLRHVRDLYLRALPESSGLARIKIEKRLGELGGGDGADAGLLAWWRFDEKTGTSATDSSGRAAALTLSDGAAWSAGRSGGALSLNGRGSRVSATDATFMNLDGSPFTVCCFIRMNGTAPYRVVTKWDMTPPMRGWVIDLNTASYSGAAMAPPARPGTVRVKMSDGPNTVDVTVPAGLTAGAWKHLAISADPKGEGLKIYVDGAQVGGAHAMKALAGNLNTSGPLAVGWLPGSQVPMFFNGDLDDLRLYGRALSAAEIKDLAARK